MTWLETSGSRARTMCSLLKASATNQDFKALFERGQHTPYETSLLSNLVSFPYAVSQEIASHTLDAIGVPEDDNTDLAGIGTPATQLFQSAVLAIYLSRHPDHESASLPSGFEAASKTLANKLNDALGHNASKNYRTTLFRDLVSVLPDDDTKDAILVALGKALRVSVNSVDPNASSISLHDRACRPEDYTSYKQNFFSMIEDMGGCFRTAATGTRHYAFDLLEGLPAQYAEIWTDKINAEQEVSLWHDEVGHNVFSALYMTMVGLVTAGARQSPIKYAAIPTEVFDIVKRHSRLLAEQGGQNLEDEAYAYWKAMPQTDPHNLAKTLAPYLLTDCGAEDLWDGPAAVANYLADLLMPFMRNVPAFSAKGASLLGQHLN